MKIHPEYSFAEPEFESITLQLRSGADPATVLRLIGRASAAATVESEWDALAVDDAGREFDLVPKGLAARRKAIDAADAWRLARSLRQLSEVALAEPVFAITTEIPSSPPPRGMRALLYWIAGGFRHFFQDPRDFLPALKAALMFVWVWIAGDRHGPYDDDPSWSPRVIKADAAWRYARGRGIRVGHADSGYLDHPELDAERVLGCLGRDFVDGDRFARDPTGNHGLGTASVLMSGLNRVPPRLHIDGVAPAASIVPLRVTSPKGIVPTPVLLHNGARALRNAIRYAVDVDCHVISISLGSYKNASLHQAVKDAINANVIICAAAGNFTGYVVWPARYPEVIAVAGCTSGLAPWEGSARGPAVDITAPAANVWRATVGRLNARRVERGSGTSLATASVAGVAALWLERHGRDKLIATYAGSGVTLQDVFRWIVKDTAAPLVGDPAGFGAGVIDAHAVVTAPLPDVAKVRGAIPPAQPQQPSPLFELVEAPLATEAERRTTVRELAGQRPDADNAVLAPQVGEYADEIAFCAATNPAVRGRVWATVNGRRDVAPGMVVEGAYQLAGIEGTVADLLLRDPRLSGEAREALRASAGRIEEVGHGLDAFGEEGGEVTQFGLGHLPGPRQAEERSAADGKRRGHLGRGAQRAGDSPALSSFHQEVASVNRIPPGKVGLATLLRDICARQKSDSYTFLRRRAADAGPIFRMRWVLHPTVGIADARSLETFYDKEKFNRSGATPWWIRRIVGEGTLAFLDGDEHAKRRQQLIEAVDGHLDDYIPTISAMVDEAAQRWERRGRFDLEPEMEELLGSLFDRIIGGDAEADDPAFVARLKAVGAGFTALPVTPTYWRAIRARRVIHRYLTERARQPRQPADGVQPSVVGYLARDSGLAPGRIADEILHLYFGGFGGLGSALLFIVQHLAGDPAALHRVREAILRALPEGKQTADAIAAHAADLASLPDVQQLWYETLRVYPFIFHTMWATATDDVDLGGYHIPRGHRVIACIDAAMHDQQVFPRPERIDLDRDQKQQRLRCPMGAGDKLGHRCLGENLALTIAAIFLGHLVLAYEWTADGGAPDNRFPARPAGGLIVELRALPPGRLGGAAAL